MFVKTASDYRFDPQFFGDLDAAFEELSPKNKMAVFTAITTFCKFGEREKYTISVILRDILSADVAGEDYTLEDAIASAEAYITR